MSEGKDDDDVEATAMDADTVTAATRKTEQYYEEERARKRKSGN